MAPSARVLETVLPCVRRRYDRRRGDQSSLNLFLLYYKYEYPLAICLSRLADLEARPLRLDRKISLYLALRYCFAVPTIFVGLERRVPTRLSGRGVVIERAPARCRISLDCGRGIL